MREFWPITVVAKNRPGRRLSLIRTKSAGGRADDASAVRIVAGILLTLICHSGCTTTRPAMKSFWQQVPPVKWPSRDANLTAVNNEPDDEPAVAANVAVRKESSDESTSTDAAMVNDTRLKPRLSRLGKAFRWSEPRSAEPSAINETASAGLGTATHSSSSILMLETPLDRLNAALTDDSLQSPLVPELGLGNLEDRIRIDSLMSRARQYLEAGQFDPALRSALSAMEISESGQIDDSPEEDRPVDLVRKIEELLEASRLADRSDSEKETIDVTQSSIETESSTRMAIEQAKPAARTEKETTGLTRIRRDWSTLFRGNRKPSSAETESGTSSSKGAASRDSNSNTGATSRSENLERQLREPDAIVMANRSIALGEPEPFAEPTARDGRNSNSATVANSDTFDTEPLSVGAQDDFESREAADETNALQVDSMKSLSDEDVGTLPELNTVETQRACQITESNTENSIHPEIDDPDDTNRYADWTMIYVAFGVCGVIAFAFYRRGAT